MSSKQLHHLVIVSNLKCQSNTYRCHKNGCFVDLMPRVLQVADLLIHAVNDLEVCLFLTFIETLQVGWFASTLLGIEETF